MSVRIIKNEDYENILVDWWKSWPGWSNPPSKDSLPMNTGVIVSNGDVDVCAGFLYLTNSKIAWIEYIVSNFEVKDRNVRSMCIKETINALSLMAKNSGFIYIYTSLKSESLANAYKECGFHMGSTNCSEMIKIIK